MLSSLLQYVEKLFVRKLKVMPGGPPVARQIWDAVSGNKLQAVLRLLIAADANVNTSFEQAMCGSAPTRSYLASLAGSLSRKGAVVAVSQSSRTNWSGPLLSSSRPRSAASSPLRAHDQADGPCSSETTIADSKDLQGCVLLHVACQVGELNLVELLLQHGAKVDIADSLGRTALHHCVLHGRSSCAKLLLSR